MKRTIILAAMLTGIALCSCGQKEETSVPPVGMMPIQQAPEITEPASEDGVGRFLYYPYKEKALYAPCGTNEICFYFEREDITPDEGYVTVYDALTGEAYDAIDVSDENRCKENIFDDTAVQYTGWEKGSCISVFFDRSFLPDGNYYLGLDEGCFVASGGEMHSREISEADQLFFGIASYGLNSIDTMILQNFVVGDKYNLGVILDGEADLAVITDYDGRCLALSETRLSDTDYFTLEFLQSGESSLTVTFYDAGGTALNTVNFRFTVL